MMADSITAREDLFANFQLPGWEDMEKNEMTMKKLKSILKESFQKSGAMHAVKAQLRKEFIKGLSSPEDSTRQDRVDLVNRIIFSSIMNFLKQRNLVSTMSVLMAETGLEHEKVILTEQDVARMVKFNALVHTFQQVNDEQAIADDNMSPIATTLYQEGRTSLLDAMFEYCLTLHQEHCKEIETQTDSHGPSVREILDNQLQELQKSYQNERDKAMSSPIKSIEERMLAYQRECEARKQREIEIQMNYFKENEIAKLRLDESQKTRIALESLRKELDFDYARRLQAHLERESDSTRRLAEQERKMQQSLYDARQHMQREIDELRNREHSLSRKMELESQGLKLLELRLREAQNILESRERELNRTEKELDAKRQETIEAIRKEVRSEYQHEQELLSKEKLSLAVEKRRHEEEAAAFAANLAAAKSVRVELRSALDQLALKEEEIASLHRHQQRMLAQIKAEEQNISELLASIDPNLAKSSRAQQIVSLIQRNADLEVKIAQLQDAGRVLALLEEKEELLQQLEQEYKQATHDWNIDKVKFMAEIEHLRKDLHGEKAKIAGSAHKIHELQELLKDKVLINESLLKQVEHQKRKEKYSHFSVGSDFKSAPSHHSTTARPSPATYHPHRDTDMEVKANELFDDIYNRLRVETLKSMQPIPKVDTQAPLAPPNFAAFTAPPRPEYAPTAFNVAPPPSSSYSNDTVMIAQRLEEERKQRAKDEEDSRRKQDKDREELMRFEIERDMRRKLDEEQAAKAKLEKEFRDKLEQEKLAQEKAAAAMRVRIEQEAAARVKLEQELQAQSTQAAQAKAHDEMETLKVQALERDRLEMQRKLDAAKQAEQELSAKLQRQEEDSRLAAASTARQQQEELAKIAADQRTKEELDLKNREQQEKARQEREEEDRLKKLAEEERQREQDLRRQAQEDEERERRSKAEAEMQAKLQAEQDALRKKQEEQDAEAEKKRQEQLRQEQLRQQQDEEAKEKERKAREEDELKKKQEDDDAAAILEARAKVLARRKQKQLRESQDEDKKAEPVKEEPKANTWASADNTAPVRSSTSSVSSYKPSFNLNESDSDEKPIEIENSGSDDSGFGGWKWK